MGANIDFVAVIKSSSVRQFDVVVTEIAIFEASVPIVAQRRTYACDQLPDKSSVGIGKIDIVSGQLCLCPCDARPAADVALNAVIRTYIDKTVHHEA